MPAKVVITPPDITDEERQKRWQEVCRIASIIVNSGKIKLTNE